MESVATKSATLTSEAKLHSAASGELVRPKPFQMCEKVGLIDFWLHKSGL